MRNPFRDILAGTIKGALQSFMIVAIAFLFSNVYFHPDLVGEEVHDVWRALYWPVWVFICFTFWVTIVGRAMTWRPWSVDDEVD